MTDNFFEWDVQYETGVNVMDKQHYGLIEVINTLFKKSLMSENKDDLGDIITELENYVVEHFNTEEDMMNEYNIDKRHQIRHKALHNEFKTEVQELIVKFIGTADMGLDDFGEYLVRWLAYHILSVDKSLARQVEFITNDNLSPQEAFEKDQDLYVASAEPLLKALKVLYNTVLEKNKEIEKHNRELEETVKQRTMELSIANQKLSNQALTDTLTSLPNRRLAIKEIDSAFDLHERYGNKLSIIFVDVDKFKSVNDTFGHDIGDEVLIWIANFLKDSTRKTDTVCRLGGDEFLVIARETDFDQTVKLAENVLNELAKDHEISKYWNPSLSLGVASIDADVKNASDLIRIADDRMYQAKQAGIGIIK